MARFIKLFGAKRDHARAAAISQPLIKVLDEAHASDENLVAAAPTIADVAMYTHAAHARRTSVARALSHIRAWLERIEALPGFVPTPKAA